MVLFFNILFIEFLTLLGKEIFFSSLPIVLCITARLQQGYIIHETATLSQSRTRLAATTAGELVFFGGGFNETGAFGSPGIASDRVDIYNVTSGIWTTATLSVPRGDLAATSSGTLVFFAGGWNRTVIFNQVDIYNTSDRSWSIAKLSQARWGLAATSVGDLVLIGGGFSNVVDIYNVTTNMWTTATLSQPRHFPAAVTVANRYALFTGGYGSFYLDTTDLYDVVTGVWNSTLSPLSVPREGLAAASYRDIVLFAGGATNFGCSASTNAVDVYNLTSNTHYTFTLSITRCYPAAAALDDLIFVGGGGVIGTTYQGDIDNITSVAQIDIYSVTNNSWYIGNLSQSRGILVAATSKNQIVFGGGQHFVQTSNAVDIFASTPPMPSLVWTPPMPSLVFSPDSTPPYSSSVVVGIVLGIVALLIGTGVVILLLIIKRQKKRRKQRHSENTPSINYQSETVVIDSVRTAVTIDTSNITIQATLQPGTETLKSLSPLQIPLSELETGKEIGEGTYGRVCVGKWKKYRVALKFCQNRGKMAEFLREANLMISLPPHPNVVRMYGVSIDGTQPIIVMEYCGGGSLDKVLYDTVQEISDEQKIRWVHEIALGMCHLHKHNIVHRDLAARNILLSHDNFNIAQLKISDFGMSRVLQKGIEGKTQNRIGPIRWMAPESIGQQVYSKKSDVWMFGVLVYEIVARCEPHIDIHPNEVSVLIRDKGLVPVIPNYCPQKLQQLMQMCWNRQPAQRPVSFYVVSPIWTLFTLYKSKMPSRKIGLPSLYHIIIREIQSNILTINNTM